MAKKTVVSTLPPEYQNELTRSDVSIYPSYSRIGYPYFVVCRQRYHDAGKRQRRQLYSELSNFENLQQLAYAGVRVHREFSGGFINISTANVPKLTAKQRKRIELIMDTDPLEQIM